MVNLEKTIRDFFELHNIDIDSSKVVIAVSTGVDSMVLLDLVSKYTNAKIIIAHVNHGKREQSAIEEKYIINYAKENNMSCYVYHIKKEEIANANFQEAARNIRYRFFKEIMIKENAKILLFAHHLNDDIETMIFRLQRGSSLIGYAGISDVVKIDEGIIVRPLLSVLKKDIIDYANINDIKYYEDSTNAEDIYSRNKIRHNDIPEIFNSINDAANNFIEMKNNIKNAAIILDEYLDNLIHNLVNKDGNGYSFKVSDFINLHKYMQRQIIFELNNEKELSNKNVDEIIKIIKSKKANVISCVNNMYVIKSYDDVYLTKTIIIDTPIINITINDLSKLEYNVGNVVININNIDSDECKKTSPNCYTMSFNYNELPLCVRTWKEGDKIITKSGTKKVSRLLIDNHVSMLDRKKTLVVCKDDNILMVVGYKKSIISLEKYTHLSECNMMITFNKED